MIPRPSSRSSSNPSKMGAGVRSSGHGNGGLRQNAHGDLRVLSDSLCAALSAGLRHIRRFPATRRIAALPLRRSRQTSISSQSCPPVLHLERFARLAPRAPRDAFSYQLTQRYPRTAQCHTSTCVPRHSTGGDAGPQQCRAMWRRYWFACSRRPNEAGVCSARPHSYQSTLG